MMKGNSYLEPIFPSSSTRPRTTASKNAGANLYVVVRDNIPMPFMLALGGLLASSLSFIPSVSRSTPLYLCAALTVSFPLRALLAHFGIIRNTRMKDVILGRTRAVIPGSEDEAADGKPPAFAVANLMARCNAPLGLFDPTFGHVGKLFAGLQADLEKDTEKSGLLNTEVYLGTTRTTGNTILTTFYFKDVESVWRFAHDTLHKSAWMEYAKPGAYPNISLEHEVFVVQEGGFDGIYVNTEPHGAGGIVARKTTVNERGDEVEVWQPTLSRVGRKDVSSRLRMGRDDVGADAHVTDYA